MYANKRGYLFTLSGFDSQLITKLVQYSEPSYNKPNKHEERQAKEDNH